MSFAFDHGVTIFIIGNSQVGKTSLANCLKKYSDQPSLFTHIEGSSWITDKFPNHNSLPSDRRTLFFKQISSIIRNATPLYSADVLCSKITTPYNIISGIRNDNDFIAILKKLNGIKFHKIITVFLLERSSNKQSSEEDDILSIEQICVNENIPIIYQVVKYNNKFIISQGDIENDCIKQINKKLNKDIFI